MTKRDNEPGRDAAKTQPPPSGGSHGPANQGSPAAPVMKEFAKTDAESGGSEAAPAPDKKQA